MLLAICSIKGGHDRAILHNITGQSHQWSVATWHTTSMADSICYNCKPPSQQTASILEDTATRKWANCQWIVRSSAIWPRGIQMILVYHLSMHGPGLDRTSKFQNLEFLTLQESCSGPGGSSLPPPCTIYWIYQVINGVMLRLNHCQPKQFQF